MDLLNGLNEKQKEAVETTDGYILVSSSPGSGKTKIITHRLAYLLEKEKALPSNVMCVTFTNKAAREMKERIKLLINSDIKDFWIGTFHSLCIRLIYKYSAAAGISPSFTIFDDQDQIKLAKEIIEDYNTFSMDPADIVKAISKAKENLIPMSEFKNNKRLNIHHKEFPYIYEEYNRRLRKMDALDFNDIINVVIHMIQTNDKVRESVQNQFKYVLSDESQDMSLNQIEFVKLVSGKYNNLTLVGDVSQCIYSWRSANPRIITSFGNNPKTKSITSNINYRSNSSIIDAANSVIKNNTSSNAEDTIANNKDKKNIIYHRALTEYDEASFIATMIDYMVTHQKFSYEDFSILFRNNAQARPIEQALIRAGIPHVLINGTGLFEREEIKDTLAYIRLLINPYDYFAFGRIITKPKRGIADGSVKKITAYALEKNLDIFTIIEKHLDCDELKGVRNKENLVEFAAVLQKYKKKETENIKPHIIIKDLMHEIGYIDYLPKDKDKLLNFKDFLTLIETWNESNDEDNAINNLVDVVQKITLSTDTDEEQRKNSVSVMTCHASKGTENEVIFVVGLEEGIFPSIRNINVQTLLEEERRLFYVAITRAKNQLYLTNVINRTNFKKEKIQNKPSRFISEIPKDLIRKV